jgi:hypothetical protein
MVVQSHPRAKTHNFFLIFFGHGVAEPPPKPAKATPYAKMGVVGHSTSFFFFFQFFFEIILFLYNFLKNFILKFLIFFI